MPDIYPTDSRGKKYGAPIKLTPAQNKLNWLRHRTHETVALIPYLVLLGILVLLTVICLLVVLLKFNMI